MRTMTLFLTVLTISCTPSRESATLRAADAYCERAYTCDWDGGEDPEECNDDMEDFFSDMWSEDECEGDIDKEGFDNCIANIRALDCDDGVWDVMAAYDDCAADEVCQ